MNPNNAPRKCGHEHCAVTQCRFENVLACHCRAFPKMHYEQRMCRTLRELKRQGVQEHLDAANGKFDEFGDDEGAFHDRTDGMTDSEYDDYTGRN